MLIGRHASHHLIVNDAVFWENKSKKKRSFTVCNMNERIPSVAACCILLRMSFAKVIKNFVRALFH